VDVVRKDSGETLKVSFDFEDVLPSGVTLSSITSISQKEASADADGYSTTTDLTLSGQALATPVASVLVAGGTAGRVYLLECLALASDGQSLIVAGGLSVEDAVG
jgi:hypothetical protein